MADKKIKPPMVKMIPTKYLFIDERYQRELEMRRVRKIVNDFSWNLFGALETSKRSATSYAVFDGQHRREAALLLDIDEVLCIVHEDLSAEEEANLFTRLQTSRKGLNQVDRFNAQVFAGNEESVAISEVISSLGLKIDRSRHSPTTISAIISLERIYRRWGRKHLHYTLSEAKNIWGGEDGSLQGAFLGGFARFLAFYGDQRYNDDVKKKLAAILPIQFMRRASAIRGGGSQMDGLIYVQLRRASKVRGAPRKHLPPV